MYKFILAYSFLLFSTIALGQIHVSGMPTEVFKTIEAQQKAWNNGDIDSFMIGYWESDSLLFIGSSGVNHGYDNTLSNYKKSYPNKEAMGTLTFRNRSWTPISKNSALLIGSWHLSEELNGMYSLIWKIVDGKWVIIADHSSS